MKKKKILIVEDMKDMQSIYSQMFDNCKNNYEIVFTNNGQEGLKELKNRKFDLVLADIIMEPMGGRSFASWLEKNLKPKICQLLLSA